MQKQKQKIKAGFVQAVSVGLAVFLLLLVSFVLPAFTAKAAAGINEQINYQGRLLDISGAVVPDGSYNMRFKVYQDGDGVLGGGDETLKWTETRESGNKVLVKNGYFSVYLGSVTAFGTSVDWNQDTLWLSIDIGGTSTPSYDGEMSPFTRLSSAPYAMNAGRLDGLDSSEFVQLSTGAGSGLAANGAALDISTGNGLEIDTDAVQVNQNYSFGWTADHTWTLTGAENLDINHDLAGSVNILSLIGTPSASAGTAYGLVIQQADSANANGFDAGLVFDNADTDLAVADGLLMTSAAGGITDALDLSDPEIINAVNAGTNYILGDGIRQFSSSSTVWTFEDTSGTDIMTLSTSGIGLVSNTSITGLTSGDALTVSNSTSTGNIAVFKDNSTAVFTLADGGLSTFKPTADSATAFQVQNAAGNGIFTVDTSDADYAVAALGGTGKNYSALRFRQGATDLWELGTDDVDTDSFYIYNYGASSTPFTLSANGAALFQNSTDSNQALLVLGQSGTWLFNVDSSAENVSVRSALNTFDQNLASTNSHDLTLRSGNASGATSDSGDVIIDAGTATGTAGAVSIAGTNATGLTLGRSGVTTTNSGALTVSQTLTASGTVALNGSTLTIGDASGDAVTINSNSWTFANDTNFALSGGVNGLSFDSDTLSIDATNNRVGLGTNAPSYRFHVVESSTSTSAADQAAANISFTDTGVVSSGTDTTSGLSVSVTRTGASGGTIDTMAGKFSAAGDTGGNSTANGVYGVAYSADLSIGLQGASTILGTGGVTGAVGVYGRTATFFSSGATASYAYGLQGAVQMDGGTATITDAAGLYISSATNSSGGTITNNYGIKVAAQTVGSSDYGIAIEAADTQTLWISSNADNTSAAAGLAFGSSRDTNLYRSAANTLKTDDALVVAGDITVNGVVTLGDGGDNFSINSNAFDVSTSGALSGISTISASGNINTTGVYQQNGTSGITLTCSSGNYVNSANINGGIVTSGSCASIGLSDERLKENIMSLEGSMLDSIKEIRTVTFDFDCNHSYFTDGDIYCDKEKQTGVIAQELQQIFPELVYMTDEGYYKVKYDALAIYNLKAVSELARYISSDGSASFGTLESDTLTTNSINSLAGSGLVIEGDAKINGDLVVDGIKVAAQTLGSSDYGIAIEAADTQTLWISSNADNTSAAAGLAFGSSRDTNLYRSAADTLKTDSTFFINDKLRLGVDARTIADNGSGTAAALTLDPTASYVEITCNDANGCDITMSETSATKGDTLNIVNLSSNTVNFADTAGVSELAGSFAAGQYDTIRMTYISDRWVELGRSNN